MANSNQHVMRFLGLCLEIIFQIIWCGGTTFQDSLYDCCCMGSLEQAYQQIQTLNVTVTTHTLADDSGLVIALEITTANQRASSIRKLQNHASIQLFSMKLAAIYLIFNQKTETQFNLYSENTH